jgi:hypothetical protein
MDEVLIEEEIKMERAYQERDRGLEDLELLLPFEGNVRWVVGVQKVAEVGLRVVVAVPSGEENGRSDWEVLLRHRAGEL